MAHIESYTPEQLRALAAKKEAAERTDVIDFGGDRGASDPSAPSQSFTVHVLGMDVTVELANLDDFELIEDIQKVQSGDAMLVPSVMRRILGEEQTNRVIEHLKELNPHHRATMTDMGRVIEAVFEYQGDPSPKD